MKHRKALLSEEELIVRKERDKVRKARELLKHRADFAQARRELNTRQASTLII